MTYTGQNIWREKKGILEDRMRRELRPFWNEYTDRKAKLTIAFLEKRITCRELEFFDELFLRRYHFFQRKIWEKYSRISKVLWEEAKQIPENKIFTRI